MVQLFWVLGHIIVFITVIAEKVGGGGVVFVMGQDGLLLLLDFSACYSRYILYKKKCCLDFYIYKYYLMFPQHVCVLPFRILGVPSRYACFISS